MKEYQIAIKTYQRAKEVRDKTLSVLRKNKIPENKITLFITDEKEKAEYESVLKGFGGNYVCCGFGIRNAVITYRKHYPTGTRVLHLDDDLKGVVKKVGNSLVPINNLDEYINKMFDLTEDCRLKLWGVYSAANAYFMNDRVVVGLKFCGGIMHGFISDEGQDESLLPEVTYKDDYNASICYYQKFGGVLRDDGVAAQTQYFKSGGGGTAGDGHSERDTGHIGDARFLARKYHIIVG